MFVKVSIEPFDPWHEIAAYQADIPQRESCGAFNSFVGTMRDFNAGKQVQSMFLEHYPDMTEKYLCNICRQAQAKWQLVDILLIHRVGKIEVADAIVLVAVWSAHRAAAFDGCRFIMEKLKSGAPFWKQELTIEGKRHWVEHNS